MKPGDLLVLGFSCQLNSVVGRLGGSMELMVNLIGLVCKSVAVGLRKVRDSDHILER